MKPIKIKPVYDVRARNGTWCTLPYPGHKKGCPKFPKCPESFFNFRTVWGRKWYAFIEVFDLNAQINKMKKKHPNWGERQCKNLLYWQKGVRSRLRKQVNDFIKEGDLVLEIPEACGIDVFKTMEKVGIKLKRNPLVVKKIMLVGRLKVNKIKYGK